MLHTGWGDATGLLRTKEAKSLDSTDAGIRPAGHTANPRDQRRHRKPPNPTPRSSDGETLPREVWEYLGVDLEGRVARRLLLVVRRRRKPRHRRSLRRPFPLVASCPSSASFGSLLVPGECGGVDTKQRPPAHGPTRPNFRDMTCGPAAVLGLIVLFWNLFFVFGRRDFLLLRVGLCTFSAACSRSRFRIQVNGPEWSGPLIAGRHTK
jgi:hypothetical protein